MSLEKARHYLKSLGPRGFIKALIARTMFQQGFSVFEKLGIHVLPSHFYSPIPDTRDLRKNIALWYRPSEMVGVDMALGTQLDTLQELKGFSNEYESLLDSDSGAKRMFGEGFGEIEAQVLYALVRSRKPKTIIEVGSGASTVVSALALKKNACENGGVSRVRCIEPYPFPALRVLSQNNPVEIIEKPAQQVALIEFTQLEAGDFLFIDSSHVVKIGSETAYLYLEVLPRLKPGVLIHIHDISFPYPTPEPEQWIFRKHYFWNEAAIVQAMLCGSSLFEVFLCTSWLHHKCPKVLKDAFRVYDPAIHSPASLWIRRTAANARTGDAADPPSA